MYVRPCFLNKESKIFSPPLLRSIFTLIEKALSRVGIFILTL